MEIDQTLKQRLVGAVVITALAAIFIPMLFDDPVEVSGQAISKLKIPPAPKQIFKTSIKPEHISEEKILTLPEEHTAITNKVELVPPAEPELKSLPEQKQTQFSRWIIQVGSFRQKKNAQQLTEKLRRQGFTAFSDTYKTKQGGVLFRVRVGPELDKQRAEAIQKKLEKRINMKSILVKEQY